MKYKEATFSAGELCFQKNYCDCVVLHWDVIPDCSAVSPSCTQMQRNIYVEICEIRHRVAPRVTTRELYMHP